MLGVFTNISEPGILAVNFEITINNSNNACNIKNKILEIGSRIKNINIDANPKIIIIPRSGLANILDIKNVKETVLKFSIVMGIIMSCAEKVMLKASAILFFIFNFTNISLMFLLNIIIPTVPINESFNPMSFIANGF